MAITRAQQYRQMLKDGKVAMQGGVKNYLPSKMVTVPKKAKSSKDHPATELAYITKAEKDLLLKKDIHNSLKGKPNKGPGGVMSLNGDFGIGESYGDRQTTDTSPEVGDIGGGYQDSGYEDRRKAREKDPYYGTALEGSGVTPTTSVATKEQEKQAKKEAKKDRRERKKLDDARRKSKLKAILAKKKTYNTFKIDPVTGKLVEDEELTLGGTDTTVPGANPFGIDNKEYQDLISSLPSYKGPPETPEQQQERINNYLTKNISSTNLDDPLNQLFEKNDRFSGVNLEAFQNEFNLPKSGITSLDVALNLAEPFLRKGSKKTKEFFSGTEDGLGNTIFGKPKKSVLEAGKYTIDGMPISPEQFAMLDPALMDDVYGDYIGRRMSGEIDAYGNPTNLNTGGGNEQQTDPCLGPNPPAYCNVGGDDDEQEVDPRTNFYGLSPRIAGSQFDFSGFSDGGRAGMMDGGMMDDTPEGGIMDLESGRQMYFLGKLVKKATRAVKKIVKSPIGKAALLAAGGSFALGLGPFASGSTMFGGKLAGLKGAGFLKSAGLKNFLFKDGVAGLGNLSGKGIASIIGGASILPLLMGPKEEDEFDLEAYYAANRLNPNAPLNTRIGGSQFAFAEGGSTEKEPVATKTMPLLDMDGQEMDLRAEGGFVPIDGAREMFQTSQRLGEVI